MKKSLTTLWLPKRLALSLSKGFTLIELLLVIAIIGILTTIIIANINQSRVKARDSKRLQEIRQVKLALELYYDSNKVYPDAGTPDIQVDISAISPYLTPNLIPIIPLETGGFYRYYVRNSQRSAYGLYVYRELTNSYCKTGVNMNPAWWSGTPECKF
jgi:prepilin-type N-terminal cleavage/methylation domain-containing protein